MALKFRAETEQDVADVLAETHTAMELRRVCADNDVTRGRGTSKERTAEKIVEQEPAAALDMLEADGHELDLGWVTACPDCGGGDPLGEYETDGEAEAAAEVHKRQRESHEPRHVEKEEWLRRRR